MTATPRVTDIIMSGPMVRALLDDRKTQTRRLAWVEHPPKKIRGVKMTGYRRSTKWLAMHQRFREALDRNVINYYELVYVRETWAKDSLMDNGVRYYATDAVSDLRRKRPAIHLPRAFSRLTLKVTATKVEQLALISPADALAEGVYPNEQPPKTFDRVYSTNMPVHLYGGLWDSLHGKKKGEAWDDNPEVVCLTFSVVKENVDAVLRGLA